MARSSTVVFSAFAIVFGALSTLPVSAAQSGGDAGSGLRLAERLCSNCHTVSPGASDHSLPARSFEALANQAGQSEIRLASTIIIPHPAMPSVALTRREIRDIVAYIMSLKASSPPTK